MWAGETGLSMIQTNLIRLIFLTLTSSCSRPGRTRLDAVWVADCHFSEVAEDVLSKCKH